MDISETLFTGEKMYKIKNIIYPHFGFKNRCTCFFINSIALEDYRMTAGQWGWGGRSRGRGGLSFYCRMYTLVLIHYF